MNKQEETVLQGRNILMKNIKNINDWFKFPFCFGELSLYILFIMVFLMYCPESF